MGVYVGEGRLCSGQKVLDEVLRNLAWADLWEELGPLSCVLPSSSFERVVLRLQVLTRDLAQGHKRRRHMVRSSIAGAKKKRLQVLWGEVTLGHKQNCRKLQEYL